MTKPITFWTPRTSTVIADAPHQIYNELVGRALDGTAYTPRDGHVCSRIPGRVMVSYTTPDMPFLMPSLDRGFNLPFALAEVLSIVGAYNSVPFFELFNSGIGQFSDNGEDFAGHYGARIHHAMDKVLDLFADDNETRQAVVPIYHPLDSIHGYKSKDIPCNTQLMFRMDHEDGEWRLSMMVTRRSNDLIWGYPYNLCQWMHIHHIMAGLLEVPAGEHVECIADLHVYRSSSFYQEDQVRALVDMDQSAFNPYEDGGTIEPYVYPRKAKQWRGFGISHVFNDACAEIHAGLSGHSHWNYVTRVLAAFNNDEDPMASPYWQWMVAIVAIQRIVPRGLAVQGNDTARDNVHQTTRLFRSNIGAPMPSALEKMWMAYLSAYPKLSTWIEPISAGLVD